jgi:hypothetical protein
VNEVRLRRLALRLRLVIQLMALALAAWSTASAAAPASWAHTDGFLASRAGTQVAKNKKAGDAFRDEIADRLRALGCARCSGPRRRRPRGADARLAGRRWRGHQDTSRW